ncbi:MAG: DegV family EDD domain-containing protein [Gammaproteobacteria bacterium]|nr:DegV family EDD domain-containing protein [Gammaproteobacteria bacterium]
MAAPVEQHLDGEAFATALTSGIHRVIGEQDLLNRINVFPVADSDTGTNLSLTLSAALAVLAKADGRELGTLLAAIADALLDGARGNSGAILAQFFQGMSDSAGDLSRFTPHTFSKAVSKGSDYAHDALSNPREGTILSVVAAFADSLEQSVSNNRDGLFPELTKAAVGVAEQALADTPKQLDVLRKAGVVDAGAKGFVELVDGFCGYLEDGTVAPPPDAELLRHIEPVVRFAEADNVSQYRFCTECLVTAEDIDRRKLREALTELGDSLVLAGTKRKAKIHIHVDRPDDVFALVERFGELSGQKADDMHRQQHSTHVSTRRFAVVTDSAADIADADMERYDIHMVPCRIQFGDRGYLDKVSISTDEFYDELRSNPHHPTTSQPAPGDFRRQFEFLASHFEDVLSINLTSAASGTYEAARSAAERTQAPGQIHVIDSLNASMGQGMLVVLAAACADAGKSLDATMAAIEEQRPLTHTYALLNELRYAVRGGRLPAWVRTVAELLRLTPIIGTKPDGRIALCGFLFGSGDRANRFARFVARRAPPGTVDVAIGHAVCEQDAATLEQAIRERLPDVGKLSTTGIGTALGVHGGPGTLIVSMMPHRSADSVADSVD